MANLDTDVPLDEVDGVGHIPGLVPDPLYPEQTAHVGPGFERRLLDHAPHPRGGDRRPGQSALQDRTLKRSFSFQRSARRPSANGRAARIASMCGPLVLERRRDFPATHWISADSIWEYYETSPFSERFWELADAYIANLTRPQLNVVYRPIFNARHEILERPAQLLKVRRIGDDQYEFDFSDVRAGFSIAKKHGADHLEWTHFFTPAPPAASTRSASSSAGTQDRQAALAARDQRDFRHVPPVPRTVPPAVQAGARRRRRPRPIALPLRRRTRRRRADRRLPQGPRRCSANSRRG